MTWAKPKYERKSDFKKIKTLADGDTWVIRILPPLFSLEESGGWYANHRQHFGYGVPDKTDPSKTIPRTFYCVENFDYRTKSLIETCPECELIKEKRAAKAKAETLMEGRDPEEIEAKTASFTSWLKKHNLENKFYYNVKFADGTFDTVKVAWTTHKLILDAVKELRARKINAIDADGGVWFEVSRSGKGFKTEYKVKVVTEAVTVEHNGKAKEFYEEKPAPLTEEDHEAALTHCIDLTKVGIPLLPKARIQALIDSGGAPEVVEQIFGTATKVASKAKAEVAEVAPKKATAPAAKPKVAAKAAVEESAEESPAAEESPEAPAMRASNKEESSAETSDEGEISPSLLNEDEFAAYFGKKS